MASSNQTGNSILDLIYEKTANIEHASNNQLIRTSISEILKGQATKERNIREATVTIKHNPKLDHSGIVEQIESWVETMEQLPPTFWQDKENSFCQFDSKSTKEAFIEYGKNKLPELQKALITYKPGIHFQRKPAKLEIANTRANIKFDRIKEILELATCQSEPLLDIREGKPHATTKARSILFRANSINIKHLYTNLDGALPYSNKLTNTRTKLYPKINVKPWQCKDCHKFGQHKCEGKRCANCGNSGHLSKDCPTKTKYCDNCKQKGHRAKDIHCHTYLNEVAKEIRKIDVPLEFYENKQLRISLAKYLQLK